MDAAIAAAIALVDVAIVVESAVTA